MIREEAFKLAMQACKETWNEKTCAEIIKALEQEPCEKVAQERYADLCEYFGGAKDILKNRKDFKAWLERVKWHIHKAEELYEKYEYKKEPCEDAISRQAVEDALYEYSENNDVNYNLIITEYIDTIPPVKPQEKTGYWIDTGSGQICSRCGEIQYGYDSFRRFCASCGIRMIEPQKSEGKKNDET